MRKPLLSSSVPVSLLSQCSLQMFNAWNRTKPSAVQIVGHSHATHCTAHTDSVSPVLTTQTNGCYHRPEGTEATDLRRRQQIFPMRHISSRSLSLSLVPLVPSLSLNQSSVRAHRADDRVSLFRLHRPPPLANSVASNSSSTVISPRRMRIHVHVRGVP
ncbi:uncharacterized protein K489DRAFT_182193 [Dissoconium aciculare CBS 342.82]|uniref:Uncharacterized protein n=1 Tax=Dissoconium aciculare CBS 342.82 TaxID=1314786 RepID=A0A6J3M8P2_9PEZI|nr:uncharacterized protein K489DRAFT_182193 [Dissoconium aciculare CBS 342.82]KAF1824421.1 hypothetical protein K489DRAFT_182193 [Dissoconium aciculare CBS 342.82]